MVTLLAIFFFLLGTIIGSFLNVVIYRYNTGMGIGGRSQCFSCGKTLVWYELIPVFSFLVLRGKCSVCKSKISWQYPAVELATGLLFLGVYYMYTSLIAIYTSALLVFMIALAVCCVLVVIFVYDARHKIIPDSLAFAFAVLGLLYSCINPVFGFHAPSLSIMLAGPLCALPFALLWLVSRGRWMGLGDAKFAFGMGFMLGIQAGLSAIIFSFWIGAFVSVMYIVIQKMRLPRNAKQLTMKSEIPFAPFLILGFLFVFFFHVVLFTY